MDNFDTIFSPSNLDENKKRAKMLFGRILINLRKQNHIKLYSLLESVVDTNIVDNVMEITLSDKISYEMLNNPSDIGVISTILSGLDSTLKLSLKCSGKSSFNGADFEKYLKNEFGKILTIK